MNVDLSAYAGEEVELILNTRHEPEGHRATIRATMRAVGGAGDRHAMTIECVSVPLLDLQAQYRPLRDELLAAIARVCDSQRFILGPEVEALERELAACLGVGARDCACRPAPTRCWPR